MSYSAGVSLKLRLLFYNIFRLFCVKPAFIYFFVYFRWKSCNFLTYFSKVLLSVLEFIIIVCINRNDDGVSLNYRKGDIVERMLIDHNVTEKKILHVLEIFLHLVFSMNPVTNINGSTVANFVNI